MGIMTDTLDRIEANLNYTAKGPGLTRNLVSIYDGRTIIDRLTLDQQGFVLRRHETAVSNFFDPAEVRSIYYPEVEHLLRESTGAEKRWPSNMTCGAPRTPSAKRPVRVRP